MSKKQKAIMAAVLLGIVTTITAILLYRMQVHKEQIPGTLICNSLSEYVRNLEKSGREKKDVIVAVIDSGYSGSDEYKDRIFTGYNFLQNNTETEDDNGHGTQIATLILSNTPDHIKLMPLKVAGESGYAQKEDVYHALEYAAANGAEIINLSLNAILDGTEEDNPLNMLVEDLAKQGVMVVVSAGNSGDDVCNMSPASAGSAIVVAAMDSARKPYFFSGYGESVDFCSMGKFADELGTSFSAAYVTSAAAILKMYSIDDAEKILKRYAESYESVDKGFGTGYVWLDTFVSELEYIGEIDGKNSGLAALSVKQEDDLGIGILQLDWKGMEPEDLERYLSSTDKAYVGMFLKSLSDEEMELLGEKCPLLHSDVSVTVCNWDDALDAYTVDAQATYDFADYCISEYENNIQQMSVSNWIINNTTIFFYISNSSRTIKYRCELSGNVEGTEGGKNENNILGKDGSLIFTVTGVGDASFPMPQLGAEGIKNFVTDFTCRWLVLSGEDVDNGSVPVNVICNSEYGLLNNMDEGVIHFGLSIPFTGMVLDTRMGYHYSPQGINAYKYNTDSPAVCRCYLHLTPTGWYQDDVPDILYIGASFQKLSGLLTATCYSAKREIGEEVYTLCPNPTILPRSEAEEYYNVTEHEIYQLTNYSSFDTEKGEMVMNAHIYSLSGLVLYVSEDNSIFRYNDIIEYVIAQNPNYYNITLDANSGIFTDYWTGEISDAALVTTCFDRTDNNKLWAAPAREGYVFAGWYTEPNGGIQVWDANGDAVTDSPYWQDGIWKYSTEDWSEDNNSLTFYANWIPDRCFYTYTIRFDANGGIGAMSDMPGLIYAQEYTLPLNSSITKERSRFINWNTMPDGSGADYGDGADICYEPQTDGEIVTLYAQWTPVIIPDPDNDFSEESTYDNLIYGWTNQNIFLAFSAVDGGSGMRSLILYEGHGSGGRALKRGTDHLGYTVTQEGIFQFTLVATDNRGNSSTVYITTRIDYTVPKGNLGLIYDGHTLDIAIHDIIEENPHNPDNAASGCKEAWVVLQGVDAEGNIIIEDEKTLDLLTTGNIFTGASYGGSLHLDDRFNYETEYIRITGYVKDNAGNYLPACDTQIIQAFAVSSSVERCLGDVSPWKAGEAGIVHVCATAFVDSMEIIYPAEWVALDAALAGHIFDYSGIREYEKREDDLFYIPLNAADGEYTIIVNVYKDGREKTVALSVVVSGSILDELRTRLR